MGDCVGGSRRNAGKNLKPYQGLKLHSSMIRSISHQRAPEKT